MNKILLLNLLSQGSNKQGYLLSNIKKFQFLERLIKVSISVLNFSTESANKRTIYDLLFLFVIYSPKK